MRHPVVPNYMKLYLATTNLVKLPCTSPVSCRNGHCPLAVG